LFSVIILNAIISYIQGIDIPLFLIFLAIDEIDFILDSIFATIFDSSKSFLIWFSRKIILFSKFSLSLFIIFDIFSNSLG